MIGNIQQDVVVDGDSISGELSKQTDWLWDNFSFEDGYIHSAPWYFIALDFSSNDFEGLTSATVRCGTNPVVDLLADADKIVILEVSNLSDMIITQSNGYKTFTQTVDLSGLTLANE